MKIALWAILAAAAIVSCQKDNSKAEVVSQHYVHKYGFDVSENEWQSRDKDGQAISVLENGITLTNTYANGILHGPTTYTFPNSSSVEKLYVYDEGVLTKQVTYDITGMPKQEEVFELDSHKIVTLWDNHGVPLSIEEYEDTNLISGKYFNPQNELESSVEKGSGTRLKKDPNGLLLEKDIFENGKLIERLAFHSNGKLQTQSHYSNYLLHGEQTFYSDTGELLMTINWVNGNMHGLKTIYSSGKKSTEIPYSRGEKQGVERRFDENGKIFSEIHWDKDKKHGSERCFKEEGEVDVKWFYHGKPVSSKKFEQFQSREKIVADKEKFFKAIENLEENASKKR
ncbi:MAG: toxin-antitoxin system YwqK family antitoxin [Chlamydiae bacterium]|nr:toxin-antitoxin system YwqK family antitoxin [Chlamydiota bacterium]